MVTKTKVLALIGIITGTLFPQIKDIEIVPEGKNTKLTLYSETAVSYTIFSRELPSQILIDVQNAKTEISSGIYTVYAGGITTISIEPFEEGNFIRFVINLEKNFLYKDERQNGNIVLTLYETGGNFKGVTLSGKTPEAPPSTLHALPLPTTFSTAPQKGIRISLNLENADIVTVIKAIAEYVGLNVVFGEEVKGKVTLRAENIPWEQAFELALRTVGLSYIYENGVYRIAPPEKIREEEIKRKRSEEEAKLLQPLITRVYVLQYAVADEAKKNVQKLLTSKGQLEVDERTNAIIITDIEEVHEKVASLIKSLDTPVYQVAIDSRILEINKGALDQMGVQWNIKNLRGTGFAGEVSGGASPGAMPGAPTLFGQVGIIARGALIDNVISMYEQRKLVKTISNPKITVLNNQKARIHGGSRIPYITRDQAGNPIVQFVDVGIRLEVTPHVNVNKQITLDIHTEVSEPGAQLPGGIEILTNFADTRVLLNNGETAVIGGLIKYKTQSTREGVPFLSRIPLIGRLFGGTIGEQSEREIVIFLTPNIVE
jgi:type IV pilus assembly protein PilQ